MARSPIEASSMLAVGPNTGDPGSGVAMFMTGENLVETIEWPN
jgi:hypothetical protein